MEINALKEQIIWHNNAGGSFWHIAHKWTINVNNWQEQLTRINN